MADAGAIYARVRLDDHDAVRELDKLRQKISQLQEDLNRKRATRDSIAERMEADGREVDRLAVKIKELTAALAADPKNATLKTELAEAKEQFREIGKAFDAEDKALDKINADIETGESQLERMTNRAGDLARQVAASESAFSKVKDAGSAVADKLEQNFKRLGKMISRVFVFTVALRALRALRDYIADYLKTVPVVSEAVARLKGSFTALAYPIINSLTPALVTLLNVLNQVVQAVAQAFAYLSGMSAQQAEEGAEAMDKEAQAIAGTGKAAKKAGKQLAAFDEINQLNDTSGGGGGSSAAAKVFDLGDQLPEDQLQRILKIVELIGAAIAAWKLSPVFGQGFLKTFGGILLVVDGVTRGVKAIKDVLENGWNTENLTEVIKAIMEIGAGIALLAGSWIPLVVAAIALVLLAITVLTGHGEELINGLKETFQGFVDFFKGVFTGDINLAVQGITKIFQGLSKTINSIVFSIRDLLLKGLDWLDKITGGKFHDIIEWAKEWVRTRFEIISQFVKGFFSAWEQIFRGFVQVIHGIFTNDWAEVWKGAKNIVFGAVNLIITAVEYIVNRVIQGVNSLIDVINSVIASDLAQKAAGFFGFDWGGIPHLSQITLPRIPMLAQGAVIPPNREFLAVLGDQTSGTNIETPLATMVQAFRQALAEQGLAGGMRQPVQLVVGRRVLGEVVVDLYDSEKQRTGVRIGTVNGG